MNKRNFDNHDKEIFKKYAEKKSPDSNLLKDCFMAFLVGGIICTVGQAVMEGGRAVGINSENLKIFVPCVMIVLSNILTATGVYKKIAKYSGAGTLVPITGFANAICSVSIDSVSEGYVLGVGAKMFTIAGPVILYGTAVSVLYGVILWILSIIPV